MPEQKPSVGRIVHFFPGDNPENALPNNMEFAPAIITQCWGGDIANMTIFVASHNEEVRKGWSVHHKDALQQEGSPYWVWPSRD